MSSVTVSIPIDYSEYMIDVVKAEKRLEMAKALYEALCSMDTRIYAVSVTETESVEERRVVFSIRVETREAERMQIRVVEAPDEPFTRPLGNKPNFWERLKKACRYVVKGE